MKNLRAALPTILIDIAGLTGAALVSFGAWQIYRPAGFIVGGVFLLVGSFLTARAAP
jgi:hypothetical protein